MSQSTQQTDVASLFLTYSAERMRKSQAEIHKCLAMLSEEQMQHRAGDYENSIVNLLLHLEGNIRQWILHGVGGQPDVRERDAEFSLQLTVPASEAVGRFDAVIGEAAAVILACPHGFLTETIDPQPDGIARHPQVLAAIYRIVAHLDHHAGQIILLTKQLLHADIDLSLPRKR